MALVWCVVLWAAQILEQAQRLAWQKDFAAAEKLYRQVLQSNPASREAKFGLAQVLLWEGRYREARHLFQSLKGADAVEGAATAAYWQGDFRTAAREFAAISQRPFARQSLSEIRSASAGDIRITAEGVDDNQPYRAWRSSAIVSSFSDPLTRWDVTAGGYGLHDLDRGIARTEPFVNVANSYVLPWQRLTITTSAGAIRYPDGKTRPTGGINLSRKLSPNASLMIMGEHRELLTNATAIDTHASLTRIAAGWSRYEPRGWMAGVEAGHNRYFDRNDGNYAQGYALWPIAKRQRTTIWLGGSAAARNTREDRFELDAISSTLAGNVFSYSYRGSYRGYWSPRDLREVRAIVTVTHTIRKDAELKAQVEGGVAHDQARAFGPSSASSPLPSNIFTINFSRTFHPYRLSAGLSLPIVSAYRLQFDIERSVTVFYAANAFRASLVRHR